MLFLESFMLTEKYYNFFCIIKIPIHGIYSKGLGFVFFLFKFRKWFKYGLKAQKLLAQGNALGIKAISKAPCKGKSLINSPVL